VTSLTNGFSKKVENVEPEVALHFIRVHGSRRVTRRWKLVLQIMFGL
jgi:hypothetical protein